METAREILQFLHYHPSSSREEIRLGFGFQESDATLKRFIAAGVEKRKYCCRRESTCDALFLV